METSLDIWSWFIGFPPELAQAAGSIVVALNVIMAVLIILWRRSPKMSVPVLWTPLALYGVAVAVRWLTTSFFSGDVAGVFWVVFSVLVLVSLSWSLVNLIRLILGK